MAIKHWPTCTAKYPEKPVGEAVQSTTDIDIGNGEVARSCNDCGASEILRRDPPEPPKQAACLLTGTGVQVASLLAQRGAIHLETLGLKHSRGSVTAIVKRKHGWKGNRGRILQQLEDYIEQLTGVHLHKRYTVRTSDAWNEQAEVDLRREDNQR